MIQALREQRAAKAKAMQDLNAPERKWNAAVDGPEWDKLMGEWSELDDRIKKVEKANALTADNFEREQIADRAERVGQDKKSPQAKLWAKWLRVGTEGLNHEELVAIKNTLSTTTGSQGGVTMQTDAPNNLLDALKSFGGMRAVSDVFRTEMGNPISDPTSDGTAEVAIRN